LSDTEIDIRDDEGQPMPPDEPGELWVRSAQASLGFFDDPERSAAAYAPDGWVRTGDLATIDERGYLTIVGRKKEIIIRGGINIAPREIEDLVAKFPEVARAAVVGLPHPRLGEQACACVVLTPGATLDLPSLVARLEAAGLAKYKLPERLVVMQELPTTASGKVQKHTLAAQLAVT
jgi:non-ribosomal peptide synthetase component E (peptide arylation enzyme)